MNTATIDEAKAEVFVGKALGDLASTMTVLLATIGDRTGLCLLYCMMSSRAAGGAALGTCGFNEQVARDLSRQAGCSEFRRVPLDNPFNNLYEATR